MADKSSVDETPLQRSLHGLFRTHGTLQEFRKNTFVFIKGDTPRAAYFIEHGLLKVCQSTEKGLDVTFFLRKSGEVFGLSEVILQQQYQRYAQCLRDCRIWGLSSTLLQEKISTDTLINVQILQTVTERLLQQQRTIEMLIAKPVSWRLAWTLIHLCEPGAAADQDSRVIKLPVTHEELASIVGCSRQTVSELLSKWRSEGFVTYNRKSIVLHSLERLLSE